MRSAEDKGYCDYGWTQEISSSNTFSFEFHKGNSGDQGSRHRMALGKPTPSKWDDAQKWLVGLSRGGNRTHIKTKPRNSDADDRRLIGPNPHKEMNSSSNVGEEGDDGISGPISTIQDEGETKNVDCDESFWKISKPPEDSSSVIRSICVRDMGTEMTPIASQEHSRTGTPLRATTPVARSPISSRSSTPQRCWEGVQPPESYHIGLAPSEKRSESLLLGRAGSAIRWSNREDEESNGGKLIEKKNLEQPRKPNPLETRAMAWNEAERAKFMARYKREEVKIQAWENHERRKAEMEMKRMEVKAERVKSRAQEKLANKFAATRRIAEEKRTNAKAKLNEQAARASERADYIKRSGHLPSSFSFKLPSLCG